MCVCVCVSVIYVCAITSRLEVFDGMQLRAYVCVCVCIYVVLRFVKLIALLYGSSPEKLYVGKLKNIPTHVFLELYERGKKSTKVFPIHIYNIL